MQFYLDAHDFLLCKLARLNLESACYFSDCGVLQITRNEYPASAQYKSVNAESSLALCGTRTNANGIFFSRSGWLNPAKLCEQLIQHALISIDPCCAVIELEKSISSDSVSWTVHCNGNKSIGAQHVVIANGHCLTQFKQTAHLPLVPARGQISRFKLKPDSPRLDSVVSGKHYVMPDGSTVLVGASFERCNTNDAVCDADHQSNLEGLKKLLPDVSVEPQALEGFAGVRATTPDRLPLVGPVADHTAVAQAYESLHHGRPLSSYPPLPSQQGLFVLGGLGSRGIVTAPFAALSLADFLMRKNESHLLNRWAPLCNPVRFQIRALKRRYNDQADSIR